MTATTDHHTPASTTAFTARDVRSALLWALEHDRHALLEHREVAHRGSGLGGRPAADRRLVARWRAASVRGAHGAHTPFPAA